MLAHDLRTNTQKEVAAQAASPFFSRLPSEIRTLIYEYALRLSNEAKNQTVRCPRHPGHHFPRKDFSIALLLTCRRIYLETYLLPIALNELAACCYRQPPQDICSLSTRLIKLSTEQCSAVRCLHLFTQQSWLETCWAYVAKSAQVAPKVIHLTLKHSGWTDSERNGKLLLDPKQSRSPVESAVTEATESPFADGSWGQAFAHLHGVREFHLELETLSSKIGELYLIVARAHTWQFPLGDGGVLVLDQKKTTSKDWVDPKHGSGQQSRCNIQACSCFNGYGAYRRSYSQASPVLYGQRPPYGLSYDPLEAQQAHCGAPSADFVSPFWEPHYMEPPYMGPSYMGSSYRGPSYRGGSYAGRSYMEPPYGPPSFGPPSFGPPPFGAQRNPHRGPPEMWMPTSACRIHGWQGPGQGSHPYVPRYFGDPYSHYSLSANFGRLRVEKPEYHVVMLKWYAQPQAKATVSAAATE